MMPKMPSVGTMNARESSTHVAVDLFCGAGGLSFGFRQAGFEIAFANDVNEEYANTYRLNHEGTAFFRESIEDLTTSDVLRATGLKKADIDLLIGGPPCQGFSINAPKRSLEDDRNHLFRDYGRLVLEGLRPKVVVMENVPGRYRWTAAVSLRTSMRSSRAPDTGASYDSVCGPLRHSARAVAAVLHRNDSEERRYHVSRANTLCASQSQFHWRTGPDVASTYPKRCQATQSLRSSAETIYYGPGRNRRSSAP